VALLVLMAGLQASHGFDAVVLHVDHGLRPDSADDARFVESLAASYGLPFHALRTRVRRRRGESLEMAARRVRLAFFARMTTTLGLDAIATGHHADDVAETFLLRLARGSGPDGLAGLKPVSHVDGVTFIRPLLNVRDSELRKFLSERGIAWHEDSTNADTSIPRNNVRHVILPFLREHLDSRITEHICKSAAILRGDLKKPKVLNVSKVLNDLKVLKDPNDPKVLKDPNDPKVLKDPKDLNNLKARQLQLTISEAIGFVRRPEAIGQLPATCELSRAALAGRMLELRTWRPGDRIAPVGLAGHSRKLQDVFVTAKVPPAVRASLPILADPSTGEVLWVPGYRVAASAAVASSTSPSWRFTLATN
jgi:tRNA(Ile)-lysidine synthetase-like protein